MANFRFHQISNTKKIRHISKIFKNSSFIVFLHGFKSDLEGKKPNAFLKFAKKNKVSFLALEYSGHGKSSGEFVNGNISKWSKETSILIKKYVKKKRICTNWFKYGGMDFTKSIQNFQKTDKRIFRDRGCSRFFRKFNVEEIHQKNER